MRLHRRHRPYLWIGIVLVAVEAAIWILGPSMGGEARLRGTLITHAGFWPGLLGDWQANFPLQPVSMFATYWLLHAGPAHLAGNLAVIAWFAVRAGPDLRRTESVEIWMASVLGGGIAFGILSRSIQPMIGASGGVFGLLGAYLALDHAATRAADGARRAALRSGAICGVLLVLSVVDFALRGGVLAWQAHLGGFVTGAVLTVALGAGARRA